MTTSTPKTHDLRERLRARLLNAPDPAVHAACVALLAEIEAALDEADARAEEEEIDHATADK